jgi:hypothetical protein
VSQQTSRWLAPVAVFMLRLHRTWEEKEKMAQATGEVVETPTAELPYKAVISNDGQLISEQYFASRIEAETFIVETLQGLNRDEGQAHTSEGIVRPPS